MKYGFILTALLIVVSFSLGAQTRSPFAVDSNTVALWHFDEGSGNVLYDASSFHNDGEIFNSQWVKGKIGSALHFNGITSYVKLPNASSLKLNDQFTIEAWISLDTLGFPEISNPDDRYREIISNIGPYPYGGGFAFEVRNLHGLRFGYRPLNDLRNDFRGVPITQQHRFYHAAMTYERKKIGFDSVTIIKTYLDGQLGDSAVFPAPIHYSNTPYMYIGTNIDGRAVGGWKVRDFVGIIDEIKISKVARKPSEFWKPTNFIDNTFIVQDSSKSSAVELHYGVQSQATYCIDDELGEFELPPIPPYGILEARFVNVRPGVTCFGQGIIKDFRPYYDSTQVDTYKIVFQPGGTGYPMHFSWSLLTDYYSGSVRLTGAGGIDVDMKAVTSFQLNDEDVTRLTIYAEGPIFHVAEVPQLFTDINADLPGRGQGTVAWGDYDNDGDLDLLMNGCGDLGSDRKSYVYRNNNGSFVNINANIVGVINNRGANWGDFDNDGDLDILINGAQGPNNNDNAVSKIYRNTNGTFTDINATLMGLQSTSAWGDYDNDGDLDIVISGSPNNGTNTYTKIYRNDGGIFTDINAGLPGSWGSSLAWGDYDNDGDLDVLITGSTYGYTTISRIYRNDGNGQFTDINAAIKQLGISAAEWGDFDADGDLDLVITGSEDFYGTNPTTKVYRNEAGNFVDTDVNLPGVYFSAVSWGDYDNDGDLDLAMNGYRSNSEPYNVITKIFRNEIFNNTFRQNTKPTAPEVTASSVNNNSVTLSWGRSTDVQTPQAGLTYNLRIGNTPGGAQIMSPMASNVNGYRKIVRMGNTNHKRTWTVKNLARGTYYFSVQAIDGAYAGSSFSGEGSFSVNTVPSGPEPFLESVSDIPSDQGGRVTLRWAKSTFDSRTSSVTYYSIWRAIPYLPSKMDIGQDKLLTESSEKTIRRFTFNGTEYAWEKIGEQEAHQFAMYSFTAPTLYNASEELDGKHYFLISAQTWDRNVYYDSNVDSGFSVDNLMPGIPGNIRAELNGQSVLLRWNGTSDPDINQYVVYRGSTPEISSTNSTLVGSTTTTQFTDANPDFIEASFYSIRAKDVNGNFGNFSSSIMVMSNGVLQSRGGVPESYAMYQNYPNPFNPSTTIWFDVKEAGLVSLNVYNTLGENVSTLVNHNLPAGKYEATFNADGLSSGVYFYQVKIQSNNGSDFVSTKKFLLMR